jgi:hypothetical protein
MRHILAAIALAAAAGGPSTVAGRVSPDKAEPVMLDLPGSEQMHNTGGKGPRGPGTGAGLCVFTSIEHSGRWSNETSLRGLQKYMTEREGGGWPEKVDQVLAAYAPGVQYLQYTGPDPAVLKLALRTGRMPCVTYGYSPRYAGPIAHMVNLIHYSDRWCAVLDNNFPGEDQYEWMSPTEFQARWKSGQGSQGGWAIVPLHAPPPPIPVNGKPTHYCGDCPNGRCPAIVPFVAPVTRCGCSTACTCGCVAGGSCTCRGRAAVVAPDKVENFGTVPDKIPTEEGYWINGRRVTALEGKAAVEKGASLIDDSKKQRLTVVGTEVECKAVLADLAVHPVLAAWKDKLLVQSYRPDDWAIQGVGFPIDGKPTIVIQGPPDEQGRGAVLSHQRSYDQGAEGLARALRQADPSYDPAKDPDLSKQPPAAPASTAPTFDPFGKHLPLCLLAGAGLVTILYLRSRKAV